MNDNSSNRGYILSVVILISVVVIGFFILVGSYGYFDKTVKEYHNAYQKDLSEKQTQIDDLEKSIEEYDNLLNICYTELDKSVETIAEYTVDNCVSYMCESPCTDPVERAVTYELCEDILTGNGNLYD
jgi:predicted PurR-regulated permease PerM|tara:strand:+ start:281 stop:664 length:384 start_codon:yes stop_codon:yes gene_type:complete